MLKPILERWSVLFFDNKVKAKWLWDTGTERRKLPRLRVEHRVRLSIVGKESNWISGSVSDCSANGLGLLSAQQLRIGDSVVVEWNGGYFTGLVRNCQAAAPGWRIGLALHSHRAGEALLLDLIRTSASYRAFQLRQSAN